MALTDLLNVTQIYELVKKGATLEAQEAILKYREEIVKLSEENLDLRKELAEQTKQLKLEQELEYVGEAYYRVKSEGQKEGPFCQRCYDVDEKLIRMTSYTSYGDNKYFCKQCKNSYRAP